MKYLSFNVSELGYIAEYAKVGKIDGALYMEVPNEVYNNPAAYMYVNGEFIDNPDYVPINPVKTVTDTDILNVLLGVSE